MTVFDVNNDGFLSANEQFFQLATALAETLDNLAMAARKVPEGMHGSALPAYFEIFEKLSSEGKMYAENLQKQLRASINVHDIFKTGDMTGAKIMSGGI